MAQYLKEESDFQSSRGSVGEFKEQVKGASFENVSCDRERRKKTKEKTPECPN